MQIALRYDLHDNALSHNTRRLMPPLSAVAAAMLGMVLLPSPASSGAAKTQAAQPTALLLLAASPGEDDAPKADSPPNPSPDTSNPAVAPATEAVPSHHAQQIGELRDRYRAEVAAGDATAAVAMGKTYDPRYVANDAGTPPDPGLAEKWYRLGAALGSPEANTLLHGDSGPQRP